MAVEDINAVDLVLTLLKQVAAAPNKPSNGPLPGTVVERLVTAYDAAGVLATLPLFARLVERRDFRRLAVVTLDLLVTLFRGSEPEELVRAARRKREAANAPATAVDRQHAQQPQGRNSRPPSAVKPSNTASRLPSHLVSARSLATDALPKRAAPSAKPNLADPLTAQRVAVRAASDAAFRQRNIVQQGDFRGLVQLPSGVGGAPRSAGNVLADKFRGEAGALYAPAVARRGVRRGGGRRARAGDAEQSALTVAELTIDTTTGVGAFTRGTAVPGSDVVEAARVLLYDLAVQLLQPPERVGVGAGDTVTTSDAAAAAPDSTVVNLVDGDDDEGVPLSGFVTLVEAMKSRFLRDSDE